MRKKARGVKWCKRGNNLNTTPGLAGLLRQRGDSGQKRIPSNRYKWEQIRVACGFSRMQQRAKEIYKVKR